MNSLELSQAQAARDDILLNDFLDAQLDLLFSSKTVGPEARRKLRGLLSYYAKKPHPFRACVKDNMKRFGPGRTEAVCATLKDIIKGTTKWRHGSKGAVALSDSEMPVFDEETFDLLMSISDDDLEKIVGEAMTYA
jgi:hypothetical protein